MYVVVLKIFFSSIQTIFFEPKTVSVHVLILKIIIKFGLCNIYNSVENDLGEIKKKKRVFTVTRWKKMMLVS